jgi:5-methylthioadenosine/S-adenosylhomocysteine deaminase
MDWYGADRVFIGGRFQADACLGVRDGTIVEVREDKSGLRGMHDFAGCAIFPGTVNTHTHAFHSLLRGCGDDLSLLKWLPTLAIRPTQPCPLSEKPDIEPTSANDRV